MGNLGCSPTGSSIQARSEFSNAAHPATLYPDEAQHATGLISTHIAGIYNLKRDILRTEVIIVKHGFESALFGRRTLSLGRGGRRTAATFVEAPFGGMLKIDQWPASASSSKAGL
jgi:hypothetical protein